MAIFRATSYTRKQAAARASIKYIENRPGKDNAKTRRTLFSAEGQLTRLDAYSMMEKSAKGSVFFRFVLSPDSQKEDTNRDLYLREATESAIQTLSMRINTPISYVAAIHDDHTDKRHVHIIASVKGRLSIPDFQAAQETATRICLEQRTERDRVAEQQKNKEPRQTRQEQGKEEAWERELERD